MSPEDERYFDRIEADLDDAFERALAARERGYDPATEIEIPVAADMADRVENILGISGVAERVRELEADHSREEAALALVTDFVEGTVGDYDGRAGKIEGAVRTAVALLTEGVVAAPIEGIDRVELLDNDDGTEFVNVYYAGPIRSAGGTAQALSVLVADYARSLLGIEGFHPREAEVERYAEEVALYDQETGLQYSPTDPETKFIAEHMPIMLDGEATGDEEVSGYRDLERVDTNSARGGMCLVLAEGIALKAPKIQRYTGDLDEVDWPWLQDLIDGNYHEDGAESSPGADGESETGGGNGDATSEDDSTKADGSAEPDGSTETDGDAAPPRPEPSKKFLRDLIAGRPVFGHPSEPGGFRLRYGRARNHGFATGGVHPATMHVVDDFLAAGTQIKTERPGKAHGIVPVDTIEGPTVRLASGEVRRIDDAETAESLRNGIEEIIDLGEYLVNYGEFVENNHPLAPASYAPEWWVQEFAAAGADVQALRDDPHVDLDAPASEVALSWAREYDCPLHPEYTYLWHDVSVDDLDGLAAAAADGRLVDAEGDGAGSSEQGEERAVGDGGVAASGTDAREEPELVVDRTEAVGRTLERLLVEHRQTDEHCRIPDPRPLLVQLGIDGDGARTWSLADLSERARNYGDPDGSNAVAAVNEVAPVRVRERAPVRIGNRMGRPEKSEDRELSPAVHTLFPLNEAGGNQRSVPEAARTRTDIGRGVLDVEVGDRSCPDCGTHTYRPDCPECGGHTEPYYECDDCGIETSPDEAGRVECPRCERRVTSPVTRTVDLGERYQEAMDRVGEREAAFDALKGVKGLSSAHKTPEPIEKGILRAKHGVSSFKDGTVRYDMTDLPVTAVRPGELDVDPEDLRALGYDTDIDGEPLRHDDQLVELKVQDVVLPDGAAEHMLRTADFVDDLLTEFYGLDPFYEVENRQDLVGELVFGMAPHTSAAVVGRVVGFTTASAGYAHPYFHAAKRRNCDGDEDCVMLLMDGLLNFSKEYLPDQRGGSVAEDARLLAFDDDGDPRFLTFDELWKELDAPVERDGKFEKKTCLTEGWSSYAFDDGDHSAEPKPIEKAIRYEADPDEELLRVETAFGRSLEITPHHSLFRYDDGIEAVAGTDLSEGDLVVAPEQFDVDAERTTIDVADCVDDPYVVVDDAVEEYLREVWADTDHGNDAHAAFDGGLSYRLSKTKLPLSTLEAIESETGRSVDAELTISLKGSEVGVDRHVAVDEEFAWLLGLFVAEGSIASVAPTISNGDESLIERAAEICRSTLGHDPAIRWANRGYALHMPAVVRELLYEVGFERRESYDSSEKVVPPCVLSAPRPVVVAFLEGLLAGDGSERSDDNATNIGVHTTSDDVKDGVVFLLHRLGLVANVSTRPGNRQEIHTITVSGGGSDNPLRRILDGEEPYRPKSLNVTVPEALLELREMDVPDATEILPKYLKRRENVSLEKLTEMVEELERRDLPEGAAERLDEIRPLVDGDLAYLRVTDVGRVDYDGYLYDLQVGGEPVFTADWLYAHNSMDAPLVMSSRIDPAEIDDEAHNVDVVSEYPREFYEATRELADPEAVEDLIEIAEDSLGEADEYRGFEHTHDTTDLALGPDLSAYKTLGSMDEKTDDQLALARRLRAVDETDVAERIIEYHFLPDLIGNLRAFARQETRCRDCGTSFRRVPLTGDCPDCGGEVGLTVYRGSVNKYMETATTVAEEFGCRDYTKQRLEVLERSLESIFENDKNRPSSLADFM